MQAKRVLHPQPGFGSVRRKQIINWKGCTVSQSLTKSRKEELPRPFEQTNPDANLLQLYLSEKPAQYKGKSHHEQGLKQGMWEPVTTEGLYM